MGNEKNAKAFPLIETSALEHLTGPSRGTVTWLSGSRLDVSLGAGQHLHVSETRPGEPESDLIASLYRTEETYEIVAPEGRPIWVNGTKVTTRKLQHFDIIEFGETGPLSRFHLYSRDWPLHKVIADIMNDGLVYFRLSRRPFANRAFMTLYGLIRRLMQETTLLFRIGIIIAIIVLGALSYQQYRLNILLEQKIETGTSRLESFSGALMRARNEALTPNDLKALRHELGSRIKSDAERLAVLERRSEASVRVIAQSLSSVVFLQGSYGFRERSSGRMLRNVIDDDGNLLFTLIGQPLLSLEGDGPVAERQFTGTGFAVGDGSVLVTNRHVALPWENDAIVEAMADKGLEPVMIKYIAYAPGKKSASAVELVKASEDADLAVLRRKDMSDPIPGLKLADASPALGDEVIVLGFPTGLRSMLAQSGKRFVDELQKAEDTGFWTVATRLAAKGLIAPLASRGIVGQATSMTIVYDADTTHGGSGGPVLDIDGLVVAVNVSVLPEYGGSNLGVPIEKLRELLKQSGLQNILE